MTGPQGSLFGAPPWISAIANTYGIAIRANVLEERGRPYAGFAYAEIHDARGDRVVSLPFCERLDPVVAHEADWIQLIAPVADLGLPVDVRVLDSEAPRSDERFRLRNELAWHCTDLDAPHEELESRLRSAARRNIRSASKNGVTVQASSTLEAVEQFYGLHLSTRKHKYRLLPQPMEFFRHVWSNFAGGDDVVVLLARHDGNVIAGMLCLRWNDVLYYKFGASLGEHLSLRPNDLLAWECIRLASGHGCRRVDWGVSDLDQPGLVEFKRKFATQERRVAVFRHTPGSIDGRSDRELGDVLTALTTLLTGADVPDSVTAHAGALLYRYFC